MAAVSLFQLKSRFAQLDRPSGQDFTDLIDTLSDGPSGATVTRENISLNFSGKTVPTVVSFPVPSWARRNFPDSLNYYLLSMADYAAAGYKLGDHVPLAALMHAQAAPPAGALHSLLPALSLRTAYNATTNQIDLSISPMAWSLAALALTNHPLSIQVAPNVPTWTPQVPWLVLPSPLTAFQLGVTATWLNTPIL